MSAQPSLSVLLFRTHATVANFCVSGCWGSELGPQTCLTGTLQAEQPPSPLFFSSKNLSFSLGVEGYSMSWHISGEQRMICRISSIHPALYGFWELNSALRAWWQAPLPVNPSYWPSFSFLECLLHCTLWHGIPDVCQAGFTLILPPAEITGLCSRARLPTVLL